MSPKKYQILCSKCSDIKKKKMIRFRSKENEREKIRSSNSRGDIMKRRKRSKTTWKKFSNINKISARSSSKVRVHHVSKRLRGNSPCSSVYEEDDFSIVRETTPKNCILSKRFSSADSISSYRNSGLNVSSSGLNSQKIGEDPGQLEKYGVPSMRLTEERRRKRIRFKIPEGTLGYEDAKKAMWRSGEDESVKKDMNFCGKENSLTNYPLMNPSASLRSSSESIQEIIPGPEGIKKESDSVKTELDVKKMTGCSTEESDIVRQKPTEEKIEEEMFDASEREAIERKSKRENDVDVFEDSFENPNRKKFGS